MRGPSVLVVDSATGQARSAVAAVRALARGGFRPVVAGPCRRSMAAGSRDAAAVIDVPPEDYDCGLPTVRRALADGGYLGALPASDAALVTLELSGAELVDKRAVAERALAAGVAVPSTEVFESRRSLLDAAERLEYPVVVKPVVSVAPARRVDRSADLGELPVVRGPVLVQPYLHEPLRSLSGVIWKGELVAAVQQRYLRTWPRDCGTACAAETVRVDEDLAATCAALLTGHDGIFQLQFAGDALLDLNPRIYGSLPLAVAAGANLPAIWARLHSGDDVGHVRGRPGVAYRWLEGDLRHLAWAVRSRQRMGLREIGPRRGTAHSVESARDPRPILRRLRHAAGRAR